MGNPHEIRNDGSALGQGDSSLTLGMTLQRGSGGRIRSDLPGKSLLIHHSPKKRNVIPNEVERSEESSSP